MLNPISAEKWHELRVQEPYLKVPCLINSPDCSGSDPEFIRVPGSRDGVGGYILKQCGPHCCRHRSHSSNDKSGPVPSHRYIADGAGTLVGRIQRLASLKGKCHPSQSGMQPFEWVVRHQQGVRSTLTDPKSRSP
ncbi:hypothetical protein CPAR01_04312 [Colletotrichum paranaense]|uniref:Uncharacterized protein n=1 Tax=Colletotrichum paranaense TaxID=1914294 RepID=A0ABQ9SW01_9PEZI|nr:uncharacterized protein CPAR01_04312 [Colletotrichum paranaense]KAK1543679.1 hypothetical protein CPAR01_04312 [Colletotrichum paranaense]